MKDKNLFWHHSSVSLKEREKKNRHKAVCVWFTGLSGSGKSTLANLLQVQLFSEGIQTYLLDGDNIRHGLNSDLGFSEPDRKENIRRIGEVAKLFVDAGNIVLASFISPYREDRKRVRTILGDRFIEVYVKSNLETCVQRDPKGLYKKAQKGEISQFTGVSSPYEEPIKPEIILPNDKETDLPKNLQQLLHLLFVRKFIKSPPTYPINS